MTSPKIRELLAIRFARLGDVILLLRALSAIKAGQPETRITLLTGHRCAAAARLCPSIDEVISVDRLAMRDGRAWKAIVEIARLVRTVRGRRFDAVIDFHSFRETNLLAWLSGAPVRLGMHRQNESFLRFCFNRPPVPEDKSIHVSEMFERVAGAVFPVSGFAGPVLEVPARGLGWVAETMPAEPRIAFYVDAPVPERQWPPQFFAAVADFAIESLKAHPAILSSPFGRMLVSQVRQSSRHSRDLMAFSELSIAEVAAVVRSSRAFISNDTGPMHLGPALGVPTLGLFSVGLPEHFRPTGPNDSYLRGIPIEKISVDMVIEKISRMWATAADRDPRR